jgi:hypothetical protein
MRVELGMSDMVIGGRWLTLVAATDVFVSSAQVPWTFRQSAAEKWTATPFLAGDRDRDLTLRMARKKHREARAGGQLDGHGA